MARCLSGETSPHPPDGEREESDCQPAKKRRLDSLEEPVAACRLEDIGVEESVGADAVVEARLRARLGRSTDAADGELGNEMPAAVDRLLAEDPGTWMSRVDARQWDVLLRDRADEVLAGDPGDDQAQADEPDQG